MFKKIATTLAATALGVASAQSWTDAAGLCPNFYETGKSKYEAPTDKGYYPKREAITLDDPSLHSLVLEFDEPPKKVNKKKPHDGSAKCMYFVTQGGEETKKKSDRFCVDAASLKKGNLKDSDPKGKKGFTGSETIPLWNVKRIETQAVQDIGIVEMTFIMRYTNFSDPSKGYYTDEDKDLTASSIQEKIDQGLLPEGAATDFDIKTIISNKHPEVLKWDSVQGWLWQTPSAEDFLSGNFLQKYFDYSMIKYDDTIKVKMFQVTDKEIEIKPGCSIDILAGSTIKGAKFNFDEAEDSFFLKNLAFRLQPIKNYYDSTHSYEQNGDRYTIGYDDDYMDGKIEYTANGYPPQSFQWKISRSGSTSVVATALTIAGALVGSWAF